MRTATMPPVFAAIPCSRWRSISRHRIANCVLSRRSRVLKICPMLVPCCAWGAPWSIFIASPSSGFPNGSRSTLWHWLAKLRGGGLSDYCRAALKWIEWYRLLDVSARGLAMKPFAIAFCCLMLFDDGAGAIVGGAQFAADDLAHSVVGIVGSRNSFCTATAIAHNLLLTAAHCVQQGVK